MTQPLTEFVSELESLCRKYNMTIYGADYHAGIFVTTNENAEAMTVEEQEDDRAYIEFK